MDGDNSRVEMKLAADEEEHDDNHMSNHARVAKSKRFNGSICYGMIAVIIFFFMGKSGHSKLKCFLSLTLGSLLIQFSKHLYCTFLYAIVLGTRNTVIKILYLSLSLACWEKEIHESFQYYLQMLH